MSIMSSVNSGGDVVATPSPADETPIPFECQFCETLYKSLDDYTGHLEVHETLFQYEHSCTVCAQKFVCKEELQLHSRLHSDLKPYKCKLCSQSFRLARNLEYHLIGHGSKRIFSCSLCSGTFPQLADMHEHLRDHQMGRIRAKGVPPATGLPDESSATGGVVPGAEDAEDKYKYIPPTVEATYPAQPPTEASPEEEEEEEKEEEEDLHTNASSVGGVSGVVGGEQQRSRRAVVAADGGGGAAVAAGAASHVKLESAASTNGGGGGGGVVVLVGGAAEGNENAEFDEEALFARAVNVKKTFCNLCNKRMATRKSLNTHYKSVHMKNAHTCSVCRTSFLFSRLLEEHTRRRKRIIPCEFCDQRFCSNKRWDSHIAKHRSDSMVGSGGGTMVMYPRAVPLSITMSRQVNNQQSQQPQQQQTVTSTTTTSSAIGGQSKQPLSLLKSNSNHNSSNAVVAASSSSSSSSPSPLSSMGGGNKTKANRSSLLLASASAQPTITLVNLTEGTNTIGKFPCDSCGKIFLSLHYLQSHLIKRRNPNFQFQCDVCEHRFSKKAILDEHKQYHSRMAAKRVAKVGAGNKQLHSNGSTASHHRNSSTANSGSGKEEEEMDFDRHIIRLSDSSFKCNCCHRTFKAINHLKCHLRYTHMKKNFKCRSCNQQFPFYKLYLAHMKNSKLCERCDKRICAKFDFKIHTQKCRGTAKMRNSTGNMAIPKSNIVEIKDDDDEEDENQEPDDQDQDGEEDDAVIIDENGGGHLHLHSSLLLPSLLDATAGTATDDYPSIPHFLMDDLAVEPEEYKCDPCGKVFSKMTSLHMHSFQHDPNKEMKCLFCNFLFLQRSSLNRHYRCRNTLHTCQVCKEAFCSHLNLRQHSCGDGVTDRSYVDSSTVVAGGAGGDDEYMDVSDLKASSGGGESRKRNRAGNVISLSVVGVNSEDVSGRDESIELSDTEPDSLACMMCTLVLNTKAELDHHVATEHGTVTKCSICCKSFRSPTILHIHMAARASKKNKIECPSCPHRFNKQAEFRKHFMYHTMKQNRPETSDEAIYSRIASKYFGK